MDQFETLPDPLTPPSSHFFEDAFFFETTSQLASPTAEKPISWNVESPGALAEPANLQHGNRSSNTKSPDIFDMRRQPPQAPQDSNIDRCNLRTNSMDDPGPPNTAQKRGNPGAGNLSVKKGCRAKVGGQISGFSKKALHTYLEREKDHHKAKGVRWMEPFANLSASISCAKWFTMYKTEVETLYLALGSVEAVTNLQGMLQVIQNEPYLVQQTKHIFTKHERLQFILDLGDGISVLEFLKRWHTYQLFRECQYGIGQGSDAFIVQTETSIRARTKLKCGNPLKAEESRLTEFMISELYPDLLEGDGDYTEKHRIVTGLRQIGKRLHYMVDKFGISILGLIPGGSMNTILKLDDKMYALPFIP